MAHPRLSRALLSESSFETSPLSSVPAAGTFDFPEKVLQFGSGRFLRAFVDHFIDRANHEGGFAGRVVIVQSTGSSRTNSLNEQNGLYTLCLRGLKDGKPVEKFSVLGAVNRALSAAQAWDEVLQCASNPDLQFIISNTTEVGIVLDPDDTPDRVPPRTFPGKLTRFLYARFQAFEGAPNKGLVLIPCELITDNGKRLQEIVLETAQRWGLGPEFADWVVTANRFCSSLVDRIVTGTPPGDQARSIQEKLGYRDQLLTIAEVYTLWAIEGDSTLKDRLAFAGVNDTIVVAEDISPYRERKIRILNGAHTIAAPLAFLLGNDTVLDAMQHPFASEFIERVMRDEIGPSLDVDPESITPFIDEVLERFRNPYLKHALLDITFQSTSKMRLRVVPSIIRHYQKQGTTPKLVCLGFAFYLWFMRGVEKKAKTIYGRHRDQPYPINDDMAGHLFSKWQGVNASNHQQLAAFVDDVCGDSLLWPTDLSAYPGFSAQVAEYLTRIHGQLDLGLDPGSWS